VAAVVDEVVRGTAVERRGYHAFMESLERHRRAQQRGRKVLVRAIEVKAPGGRCPNGHRVGHEYLVGGHTVKGICIAAFGTFLPYLTALRWGASFPWEDPPDAITVSCPDCENQVVWRLEAQNP